MTEGGDARGTIASKLLEDWFPHGPSICFVAGFSGVGTSELAEGLARDGDGPVGFVRIVEGEFLPQDVTLEVALQLDAQKFAAAAEALGSELERFLGQVLEQRCLVVLDNFERLWAKGDGALPPSWRHALRYVSG